MAHRSSHQQRRWSPTLPFPASLVATVRPPVEASTAGGMSPWFDAEPERGVQPYPLAALLQGPLLWQQGDARSSNIGRAALERGCVITGSDDGCVGVHTVLGSDKDTKRLHSSFRTSSELVKRQRKATKLEKLTTESSKKQEGKTYSAGSFEWTLTFLNVVYAYCYCFSEMST